MNPMGNRMKFDGDGLPQDCPSANRRPSPLIRLFRRFGKLDAIKALMDEQGVTLVSAAMCMSLLMGFTGLGVDVGLLLRDKRMMQTAADAGAMNGAAEIPYGDSTKGAKAATAQNGFADGVNGVTVTVNNPPLYGAYAGTTGYVEVIVSKSEPVFFMNIFGFSAMNVAARAVGENTPTNDCIFTLGQNLTNQTSPPGATGAGINASGSGSLDVPTCGIVENSDDPGQNVVNLSGSATITAKSFSSVGTTDSDTSHITVTNPSTPQTGIAAVSDPLSGVVTPPTNPGGTCVSMTYPNGAITAVPSTTCYSSLTISGTVTVSGVYYIQGNLTIQGGAIVTSTGGTTFYVTCNGACASNDGVITVSASTLNLYPPTSGSTANVVFYQDANDPETASMQGGSAGTLQGIIYLPDAGLTLGGGSGATFKIDLITQWLNVTGPSNITPYENIEIPSSVPDPILVE